jgi:hypothetical protein
MSASTALPTTRCTLATIVVEHELLEMWRYPGDPSDTARLSHVGTADEIGRVVDLNSRQPKLATALAVWSVGMRSAVLLKVRDEFQFVALTREVLA